MAQNHRDRTRKSNSVVVGIVAFLLGFLFALIVLFGSIFGIGYVAATTDINKVLSVFGLENKNAEYDENDPDSNKYNYINADQASNLYELVKEIIGMANDGLGEINLDRIGALAPITDTVLDMGYKFIDGVVDFDKPYFEDVPLTSIIDCVKNSMFYVHTGKIIETLNKEAGTELDLSEVPIAGFMIDGIEAEYATVSGKGEDFRLPVLFDYYVDDGSEIGYGRTVAVDGVSAYPDNLRNDTSYIQETTLTNEDGKKLYKVFYVPCKVTPTGIEEAEYITEKITVEDSNVTFSKDGQTVKLKYVFTVLKYGDDTDFIAVKPSDEKGSEKFTLNFSEIIASKNNSSSVNASNRYIGYSYYEDYARCYYDGPTGRTENDMIFGVTTVNNINFFKDNAGNIIEYDPLLVSDLMIDPMETLNHVPVWNVVNASQAHMVADIFGDTSLGDVLNQNVNFNELIDGLELASFITGVDPEDQVMSFLVYNISDVKKGADGTYTATYDKNGENLSVTVKVNNGEIVSVKDAATGNTLKGNTVADISSITSDLTLDIFMEIKADDAIMTYLGYGVSDVYEVSGQDYTHVGTYENNELVHIYTNPDGTIDRIETETGMVIKGTDINGVSDRVNGVTDVLALPDFIDVDPEESILAYIGYGVYDVEAQTGTNGGKDYQYTATYKKGNEEVTAYIAAEVLDGGGKRITSVWTDSGSVSGTKINEVSDRIDGITDVLVLPDFIDVDPEESILSYIGYGVYDIEAQTGTNGGKDYQYTATYDDNGTEVTAYIASELLADGTKKVTSVWTDSGKVGGTKINGVSDRLDTITDVLTINEFMDIDPSDAIMAYMGYGVTKCEAKTGTDSLNNQYDYICKYTPEGGTTEYECYISVDAQKNAESVWYIEGGVKKTVKGTKIAAVPDRINGLQEKLTIGELVTVDDENSSMILKAIKDTTISGLDDRINQLTVSDVLDETQINNNSVLPQLRDTHITELGTAIDKVLIQRIYAEKIYELEKDAQGQIIDENPHIVTDAEFNPAYLYYEKDEHGAFNLTEKNCAGLTGTDYDNALGKLTQADWEGRGDTVYYTYGEAKGMWKLILNRMDGGVKTEKAYTINNFNNMVTACSDTVYNSTLGELKEAGIISGGTNLDKALKAGVDLSTGKTQYLVINNGAFDTTTDINAATKMQDLTLKQLLDFVSQFIGA